MAIIIPTIIALATKIGRDFLSSKLGGNKDNATKLANYNNDVVVNTGHAVSFFNVDYDKIDPNQTNPYSDFLTKDEWNYLASVIVPKVQTNPYYGGLNTSFTSKYTNYTTPTVPNVGIVKDIEAYIDEKVKYGQTMATTNQTTETSQSLTDIILAKAQQVGIDFLDYWSKQEIASAQQGISTQSPLTTITQTATIPYWVWIALIGLAVFFIFIKRRS